MPARRFEQRLVLGIPKGLPSRRSRPGGKGTYLPNTADAWKNAVREAWRGIAEPFDEPVSMSVDFFFPRPKRLAGKRHHDGPLLHFVKPDLDNLMKATKDAMTEVGAWSDDKLVCRYRNVCKWYCSKAPGALPGAVVFIETIEQEES